MNLTEMLLGYMADLIIFFIFLNICSPPKYNPILTFVIMIAMRVVLFFIILPFLDIFYVKAPYALITGILMSWLFFEGRLRDHIANVFLFWMSCVLSEFIVIAVFSLINGGEAIMQALATSRVALSITNYFLIFVLSCLAALFKRKKNVEYSNAQIILICATGFIPGLDLLSLGIFTIHYHDMQFALVGGLLGALGMVIVAVLARRVTTDARHEMERSFKLEQLEIQKKQYSEIQNKYDTVRKLRHDINNHIQTMIILQENGNTEAMERYLAELNEKLEIE